MFFSPQYNCDIMNRLNELYRNLMSIYTITLFGDRYQSLSTMSYELKPI